MSTPRAGGTFGTLLHRLDAAPCPTVQLSLGLRSLVLVDDEAEMRRRLAYAIRAAMAAKDWKVPDLARALGRDPGTVDRWANGRSVPNIFHVRAIANALGVKPELIYDPPPVPDYPLSDYLVREAGAAAVEEGIHQARRRRAGGDA